MIPSDDDDGDDGDDLESFRRRWQHEMLGRRTEDPAARATSGAEARQEEGQQDEESLFQRVSGQNIQVAHVRVVYTSTNALKG